MVQSASFGAKGELDVQRAPAAGTGSMRVVLQHVLPIAMAPVLVLISRTDLATRSRSRGRAAGLAPARHRPGPPELET